MPCTTRSRIAGIDRARTFPPILGYLALPGFERHLSTLIQFVPYLFEKAFDALRLDGLERHAVNTGASSLALAPIVRMTEIIDD